MASDPDLLPKLERFLGRAVAVKPSAFQGSWQRIVLQPDLFVPQTFDVGVFVTGEGEAPQYELVDDFSKFESVYGRAFVSGIRQVMHSIELELGRLSSKSEGYVFSSGNVFLGSARPTAGSSAYGVASRLFSENVVMQPAAIQRALGSNRGFSTARARILVANELKRIGGLAYERIAVDTSQPLTFPDSEGDFHTLDVTLVTTMGAGNVVSGTYRTPNILELSLLRAGQDVSTFARIKNLREKGIFILAPSADALTKKEFAGVSEVLKEQEWRLKEQGFRVVADDKPAPIAERILEWAGEQSTPLFA